MRCPESATISEVRNMMPFEKEENTGTSKGRKKYISQNLKPKGDTPRPLEAWKNKDTSVLGTTSPVKREDPRKKAQEQLAEEVADVVMSDFAQSSAGKGMSLEDLIGSLVSDPFLSKNQIPRTPENLITEIRRSWRKAIEDEDSSDAELAHAEIMTKKAPQDTEPAFQIQTDSSMACFMSFSRLSDLDDATALQEQVVTSYSSESPMQQPAAGKSDDKTHLEPRLTCVASNKSVLKTPEESVCPVVDKSIHNVLDYGTEEHVGTIDTLVPFLSQNSSGHTTLSWNASQMVGDTSSDSRDAIQFGILHETLPEQVSNTSLNSSKNVETDDEGTEEDNFRGSKSLAENLVKDEWTPVERKQYLQSIRSKLEALKKTASGNEEDSSPRTQFIRRRSELSVTPRSKETSDVFSPLVKLYSLDAEHIKTPCESHLERKLTLSPLIAFSPVQARQRSAMHKPGDFLLKLKGESLGTKESSSEANTCKDEAVSQLIEL
uniref:HAUS augmin-like complex subunit 6 n=1 Tax=Sphenodon punctatus TaxID=8508 RepID=A0A8D0HN60_SPHPU